MDQSLTYVKDQLAQGKTRDQIRAALVSGGWQSNQIDALFIKYDTVVPSTPSSPVATQSAVAKSIETTPVLKPTSIPNTVSSLTATKPVDIVAPGKPDVESKMPSSPVVTQEKTSKVEDKKIVTADMPKKSSIWKVIGWTAVSIVIAVAALLGAAYYLGQKNKTATTTDTSVQSTLTVATYKANGISFTYPVSWRKASIATLLNIAANTATEPQQDLFFTTNNYTTVQQAATDLDKTDAVKVTSFTVIAGNLASLSANYVTNASACPTLTSDVSGVSSTTSDCTVPTSDATAKAQASNVLKTTYAADGTTTYNSAATVDATNIKTVTVDGVVSYWVTSGTTAKPFLVLSVPVTSGAFTISFPGATSLDTLSSDLQRIYASIKVQ